MDLFLKERNPWLTGQGLDDPKLASKHLEPNIASNLKDSRVHRKCEKEHEYSCEDGDQIMNTHVKQSSATVIKGHMSKENVSWF
jgi:hypothetical protein